MSQTEGTRPPDDDPTTALQRPRAARRGRSSRGGGTIYFNEARNRWQGMLDVGVLDGKRVRRTVTGRTQTEVGNKLRELQREHTEGLDRSRRVPTVAQLTDEWLTKAAARTKAPSTLARVRRRVEQHVTPKLGDHRVDRLRPEHVEEWLAGEVAAGAALRTVQDYRGDLRQILAWAQRRRLVSWNVAAIAELPADARPPTEKRTLTEDQAAALLASLDGDRLGPYWTTLLLLGIRPGEADALTWDAVAAAGDGPFEVGGQAVINRALQRDDHGRPIAVGPTKTKQTRVLALHAPVAAALRRQRVQQLEERVAAGPAYSKSWSGHVFLNELGRPMNPSNVRRAFTAACRRAEIGDFTPYELRHSTASLLIAAGVPPFEVADQLGHSDLRMLERHYRHKLNPVVGTGHDLGAIIAGGAAGR